MWHRSCTHESSQDKVSSVRSVLSGVNQYQDWIYNGTDNLVVGYGKGRIYHDSAEHLVVYVAVQMFHQLPVGESSVGLQSYKDVRKE